MQKSRKNLDDLGSGNFSMKTHAANVRPIAGGNALSPELTAPIGPVVLFIFMSLSTAPLTSTSQSNM